jgi:hypothetical protein
LLIVALRFGNVHAKTIDELLHLAAERRDKTVQWTHPEQPVLCAFGNVDASIQLDKHAGFTSLPTPWHKLRQLQVSSQSFEPMIFVMALHKTLPISALQSRDMPPLLSLLYLGIPRTRTRKA